MDDIVLDFFRQVAEVYLLVALNIVPPELTVLKLEVRPTLLFYFLENSENILSCMRISNPQNIDEVIFNFLSLQQENEVLPFSRPAAIEGLQHFLVKVALDKLLQLSYFGVTDQVEQLGEDRGLPDDVGFYFLPELYEEEREVREGVDGRDVAFERFHVVFSGGLDKLCCDDFEVLEFLDLASKNFVQCFVFKQQG